MPPNVAMYQELKVRGLVFEAADVERRLVEVTVLDGGDDHLPVMEPILCPDQPMRTVTRVIARLHADTDAAYYHIFFAHDESEPLNLSLVRTFPASRVKGSVAILRYDEVARAYTNIDGLIERLMAMVCLRSTLGSIHAPGQGNGFVNGIVIRGPLAFRM